MRLGRHRTLKIDRNVLFRALAYFLGLRVIMNRVLMFAALRAPHEIVQRAKERDSGRACSPSTLARPMTCAGEHHLSCDRERGQPEPQIGPYAQGVVL